MNGRDGTVNTRCLVRDAGGVTEPMLTAETDRRRRGVELLGCPPRRFCVCLCAEIVLRRSGRVASAVIAEATVAVRP